MAAAHSPYRGGARNPYRGGPPRGPRMTAIHETIALLANAGERPIEIARRVRREPSYVMRTIQNLRRHGVVITTPVIGGYRPSTKR